MLKFTETAVTVTPVEDQTDGILCEVRVPRASRPSALTSLRRAPHPPDRVRLVGV